MLMNVNMKYIIGYKLQENLIYFENKRKQPWYKTKQ